MRAIVWAWLVSLLLAMAPAMAAPTVLRAVGDNWCPYNCNPDASQQGYMVELVRAALLPDVKLIYRLEPWTRAVDSVSRGEDDLLLATTHETTPDLLLGKPLGVDRTCFFVSARSKWQYRTSNDLADVRLGVIQDYKYDADGPLDRMIAAAVASRSGRIDVAAGDDALRLNFRKLAGGRVDVVVENENVGAYALRQLKLRRAIRSAGCLDYYLGTVHVGIARTHPQAQAIIDVIDRHVDELRRRKQLAPLMQRYGLTDWFPLLKTATP